MDQSERAAFGSFGRDVSDGKPRGPAGEAAIGDERANLAQPLRLQIAGRIQHLLHAGSAFGAFIADEDHVAGDDFVAKNGIDRCILALEDARRTGEGEVRGVDARGLHNAALFGDVAEEHGESAIQAEGVRLVADDAFLAVGIERGVTRRLAEWHNGAHAAGCGAKEEFSLGGRFALQVVRVDGVAQRGRVHGVRIAMDEARAVEFGKDVHDAAGAMHVFDVDRRDGRRDFAEMRHPAREPIDVGHGEGHFALLRGGQQMQHGVGGAAHGDVEGHRIFKRVEGGDGARQRAGVVLLVIAMAKLDSGAAGAEEELFAVRVRGHDGAVAGQREAERFGEAIHGVGGEHAGAGTAGGAGGALVFGHVFVGDPGVGSDNHGVDQVNGLDDIVRQLNLASLHGPAGDKDCRNVEAHGGHQHAGRDFVAI